MKKTAFLLFFCFTAWSSSFSQTFENGLELYDQGDYKRAIRILSESDAPEAILFTGKSYFALNNYLRALAYLKKITPEAPLDIYQDALYTSALAHFQLDNFEASLSVLKYLGELKPATSLSRSAISMYDDVLGYLNTKQRFDVFRQTGDDEIRLDLLESAIGKVKYETAITLLNYFRETSTTEDENRLNRLETILSDSVSYWQRYNPNQSNTAPKGISYNIGVVLPEFEYNDPNFDVPQHLYFGIQLAVESFNSENQDQKAFLTYRNSFSDTSDAELIINDLVWNHNVDAIIGPLFSDMAKRFSTMAEAYEVPMLLPLANADSLDLYNDYVFQLNPNFATQGKHMARYAVKRLGYDTLGVIVERGALGTPAARAFMHEAERLGGFVEYYFEENLEAQGYDIREYTQYFTTDPLDSVAMVKAVYAPFTGAVAPTLIESMLTDLEAMRSEVAILGSEEWMNVNLENRRLSQTELYYTEALHLDTTATEAQAFASDFRIRYRTNPNQFAYIGYDAASIILDVLKRVKNPAELREALQNIRNYQGLSTNVSFDGTHVNQKVLIRRKTRY